MKIFWRKHLTIFRDVKNEISFSHNTFDFRFAEKENFFQENFS